jgi:hypothetical protein
MDDICLHAGYVGVEALCFVWLSGVTEVGFLKGFLLWMNLRFLVVRF